MVLTLLFSQRLLQKTFLQTKIFKRALLNLKARHYNDFLQFFLTSLFSGAASKKKNCSNYRTHMLDYFVYFSTAEPVFVSFESQRLSNNYSQIK